MLNEYIFLKDAIADKLVPEALANLSNLKALTSWHSDIDEKGDLEIPAHLSKTGNPIVVHFSATNQAELDKEHRRLEAAIACGNDELAREIMDNFPSAIWG